MLTTVMAFGRVVLSQSAILRPVKSLERDTRKRIPNEGFFIKPRCWGADSGLSGILVKLFLARPPQNGVSLKHISCQCHERSWTCLRPHRRLRSSRAVVPASSFHRSSLIKHEVNEYVLGSGVQRLLLSPLVSRIDQNPWSL